MLAVLRGLRGVHGQIPVRGFPQLAHAHGHPAAGLRGHMLPSHRGVIHLEVRECQG